MGTKDSRTLLPTLSILSVGELIILPSLIMPSIAGWILLQFIETNIFGGTLWVAGYVLCLALLCWIVDVFFGFSRDKTEAIPVKLSETIKGRMLDLANQGAPNLSLDRLRFIPSDFSVGAHVSGVWRPTIVISGGMMIGLVRNVAAATSVLVHEIGHIANWDRFFYATVGLWGINAVLFYPLWFIFTDPWTRGPTPPPAAIMFNVFATGCIVAIISRRREYNADIYAAALSGTTQYIRSIEGGIVGHGTTPNSIFHPPLHKRLDRLKRMAAGEQPKSAMWVLYLAYIVVAGANVGLGHPSYFGAVIGGFLGICFEIVRGSALRTHSSVFADAVKEGSH